jgi:hypothetical protein
MARTKQRIEWKEHIARCVRLSNKPRSAAHDILFCGQKAAAKFAHATAAEVFAAMRLTCATNLNAATISLLTGVNNPWHSKTSKGGNQCDGANS